MERRQQQEATLPENQMLLSEQETAEMAFFNRGRKGTVRAKVSKNADRGVRGMTSAVESMNLDADLFSNKEDILGRKNPSQPKPLTILEPQLMSLFNTTLGDNVPFAEVVKVLEEIPNLDFDANVIFNSALGIYYETSKRVQFRLGLFLNPAKETILDCRRVKGDSFVMGNFFSILTKKMSARPELGVKVVYEEEEVHFDAEDEGDDAELDALFGQGHLRLQNDPKLVKHFMKEIASSDLETQVIDTGLLAHAAELDSNVDTLASEGGEPLVELLGGKLQHHNAALVRQSAVLLKELTRMHPEIFSEKTAESMLKAMGKWAPKLEVTKQDQDQRDLVSSRSTVTNLAEGFHDLMQAQGNISNMSLTLPEADVTGIINTLQQYPSPKHEHVVQWMSDRMNALVC